MQVRGPLLEGRFLRRPNRFIAIDEVDGEEVRCFLPNPGRLAEFLTPGRRVLVQPAPEGSDRATRFTHLAFRYNDRWISVDTHAPNKLFREAFEAGILPMFGDYDRIRGEVPYHDSRLDFLLEDASGGAPPCFVEVKSVTLVVPRSVLATDPEPAVLARTFEGFDDGVGLFPDAVSERGARHMRELARAHREGYRAVAFWLVQRDDAVEARPHDRVDPGFGEAVREASAAGVEVVGWAVAFDGGRYEHVGPLPVVLP